MKFSKYVEYLEELEKISSRLKIIDVVADLIVEMNDDEVEAGVYLCLGSLAPSYKGIDFGMADKMVVRALARVCGDEIEDITREYKRVGDLGIVAEEMSNGGKGVGNLMEVHEKLREIAMDGGAGSQERKVDSLVRLLDDATKKEARFLTRMVLGKLRLGFSDKTILEAISKIESGGRTKRKDLDEMYQIYPDVGKLAWLVKTKGLGKAKEMIDLEVGVPVMPALCQRLNTAKEIVEKMGRVAVERKYDGTRVQIHFDKSGLKTFSRNLEETSWMFPELKEINKWIGASAVIFDCEAVGVDPKTGKILPFQETITRKRKHNIGEVAGRVPLRFFVFDILYCDGKSYLGESYKDRREKLGNIIKPNEVLVVDEYYYVEKPDEVHSYHELFLNEGYEGAVVKKWDGKYLPGRQGWNWVKIKEEEGTMGKLADTLDLVVMGYYRGRGKRSGFGIGAFLAGVVKDEKILTIAKIGTGLTDDKFRELKQRLDKLVVVNMPKQYAVDKGLEADVWVEPRLVVEVAADEITKSPTHSAGVALRFPRLVKFRDDKDVEQATSLGELERIKR